MNRTTPPRHAQGTEDKRSMSLATRFLIAFVVAAVLPLTAISVFQIINGYSVQSAQVADLQGEAARNAANVIDAYLKQIEDEMTLTAREWALQDMESRPALLDTLLAYNDGFETLILLDESGEEIAKTSRYTLFGPEDMASRADSPEFLTVQQGERYLGPISVSQYGEPLVMLAIPVKDVRGKIEGVLTAEVNLKYMWDIIAHIEIGRGGYAYVVDNDGRLIAHRDSSLVLQGRDLSEVESIRNALSGQGTSGAYAGLEGQRVVGSYQPLRQARWFVLVETPTREALADVYRTVAIGAVVAVVTLILAILLGWYMAQIVVQPVRRLQEGSEIIGGGDLAHRIEIRTRDEIGSLASAFNAMAAQLQEMISTLEQRVAERTRGLQTAAEVSRTTTSVLDPDELLRQTVDLVRERFDLYYVGLFLLDETGQFAVLRAGTGEAGQQMLAQGHRLAVGGVSMIGQCTAKIEARIALDVGEEAVRFDNPLLPETRSEMALPLRSRGRVIGAMTVQSVEEAGFDEADIAVMQTMADQVAVAIDNARLFAETQAALKEAEDTHRRYLGWAWAEYARARAVSGYQYSEEHGQPEGRVMPLGNEILPEAQQAMAEQRPLVGNNPGDADQAEKSSSSTLVTPIMLRGQPIGALGFKRVGDGEQWSADDIALAEMIAEQFALAAENLRLFEDIQRRAARERLTGEVTTRMRETLDVETVLQTAVHEIGESLGLHDVTIQFEMDASRIIQNTLLHSRPDRNARQ